MTRNIEKAFYPINKEQNVIKTFKKERKLHSS